MLSVDKLHAFYGKSHVLQGVSLQVQEGELVTLLGRNGAGKTTTLKTIAGVMPPTQGQVRFAGEATSRLATHQVAQRGICLVPEDRKRHGIVPLQGVGANITMAVLENYAKFGTINSEAELKQIQKSIDRMRIKTASPDLPIKGLSGGNQQKAILARCLLLNPRILILDEPTRGIDIGAKYEIYKLINQLVQQGIAVIVISSELPEVLGLSDRVLVMHEGKLKANLINQNLTQEQVMEAALRSERHVEKQSV